MISKSDLKQRFFFEIQFVKRELSLLCKACYAMVKNNLTIGSDKAGKYEKDRVLHLNSMLVIRRWMYLEVYLLLNTKKKSAKALELVDEILGLFDNMGKYVKVKPEFVDVLGGWYDFSKIRNYGNNVIDNFEKLTKQIFATDIALFKEVLRTRARYMELRDKLAQKYKIKYKGRMEESSEDRQIVKWRKKCIQLIKKESELVAPFYFNNNPEKTGLTKINSDSEKKTIPSMPQIKIIKINPFSSNNDNPKRPTVFDEKFVREMEELSENTGTIYNSIISLCDMLIRIGCEMGAGTTGVNKANEVTQELKELKEKDKRDEVTALLSVLLSNNEYSQARDYCKEHIKSGHPYALYAYGYLYLIGKPVSQNYDKAMDYFFKSIEKGCPEAVYQAGYMYENGFSVKKDPKKAAEYYKMSEKMGCAKSLNDKGDAYYYGIGVKQSYKEAYKYFKKSAEKNDGYGQLMLGMIIRDGRIGHADSLEAIRCFRKALQNGRNVALARVAEMFLNGLGFKPNFEIACAIYNCGVTLKEPEALVGMGLMFSEGKGVKKDLAEAFKNFKKAADREDPVGQYYTAKCLFNGEGAEKDLKQAFKYFKISAECGVKDSEYYLGCMYLEGEGVKKDYKLAYQYLNACAERGSAEAMYKLCYMYLDGNYVKKDEEKGLSLLKAAAKHGCGNALYVLGNVYSKGLLNVKKDYKKAFENYTEAAEKGHDDAFIAIASMHLQGLGTPKDEAKGIECFQQAADRGNAQAAFMLGSLYCKGKILKQNYLKGYMYLQRAAYQGIPFAYFSVGRMQFKGEGVKQEIQEGLNNMKKSAELGVNLAQLYLGDLYYLGTEVKKNIKTAKKYWKMAAEKGNKEAELRINKPEAVDILAYWKKLGL